MVPVRPARSRSYGGGFREADALGHGVSLSRTMTVPRPPNICRMPACICSGVMADGSKPSMRRCSSGDAGRSSIMRGADFSNVSVSAKTAGGNSGALQMALSW